MDDYFGLEASGVSRGLARIMNGADKDKLNVIEKWYKGSVDQA